MLWRKNETVLKVNEYVCTNGNRPELKRSKIKSFKNKRRRGRRQLPNNWQLSMPSRSCRKRNFKT
jgi:hypothetical protein